MFILLIQSFLRLYLWLVSFEHAFQETHALIHYVALWWKHVVNDVILIACISKFESRRRVEIAKKSRLVFGRARVLKTHAFARVALFVFDVANVCTFV